MVRDPRYDILFEPVKIGPVTARNRFFQVPHCTGAGYRYPEAEARMRGVKAEGGWAVISTQEVEIHHGGELSPFNEGRLWDDDDIPALALMAAAVHEHGSLAAIELAHNGAHAANRFSREIPLAPSPTICDVLDPVQARGLDKADIADLRRAYRAAARRGLEAGFDIIYVYAGHDMSILQHFLSRRHNHRSDEYGGSFGNRLRLFREVLGDTRETVGDKAAVAVRLAVDELIGPAGICCEAEGREVIEALGEVPDLWDVNISDWSNDSQTSRFAGEGFQEKYISFVKSVTTKPVVGVGRYTSPDTMVRVIRQGIMDFIGAARPSIADPFLPKKIEEGRIDDIRECIGCNICITGDNTAVPMRCTQNPTKSEEWRKGWHPEFIPPAPSPEPVLVIGGGPAGLEAARALGQRGVPVMLAEASGEWGGRVAREARLPGLAAWARVRDWRLGQLHRMAHVKMYLESRLTAEDALSYGIAHVVLATGGRWRADGVGRYHHLPLGFLNEGLTLTPDDLMAPDGIDRLKGVRGPVVIFDDDRFYMASVLAERLVAADLEVVLVTPAGEVSPWSQHTLEQVRIQRRLIELEVELHPHRVLAGRNADSLDIACAFTGRHETIACGALVTVTSRLPEDALWHGLQERGADWQAAGIKSVVRIGDCLAPGIIAAAVYSGHRYAREFGELHEFAEVPFEREDRGLKEMAR